MDTKQIEKRINEALETEDKAFEGRRKASKTPAPHAYPQPRRIFSAKVAQDEGAPEYIRALIKCGANGVGGLRILNIPITGAYIPQGTPAPATPVSTPAADAEAAELRQLKADAEAAQVAAQEAQAAAETALAEMRATLAELQAAKAEPRARKSPSGGAKS